MNCREFHRNLEDYLQGGLDFSGRFRLEHHARQCAGCGRELAGAERLRHLASELGRVRAPENFESSVLEKIADSERHGFFFRLRSFGVYGAAWPSRRSLMLAASAVIVMGALLYFASDRLTFGPSPELTAGDYGTAVAGDGSGKTTAAHRLTDAGNSANLSERRLLLNRQLFEPEYVDFLLLGPDAHPAPSSLPDRIWMPYGQATEEYFIRNVSH